jgi:hypothetical protein
MKKQNILTAAFIVLSSLVLAGCSPSQGNQSSSGDRYDTETTRSMIRGIEKLEEVAWVKTNRNTVYVGLREVPADMKGIANAWALQFNREWNFGAHVWMLPESAGTSDNPDLGRIYYEVTARHGKIE